MADLCAVCEERPLRYVTTSECSRCYNRRYVAANRDKVRAYKNDWQAARRAACRDRIAEMPEFDLSESISYRAAHDRVAYWRGRAAGHACPCGSSAREWAYQGGCPYEIRGLVEAFARKGWVEVAWSPDPRRYAAMCRSCHVTRDLAAAR